MKRLLLSSMVLLLTANCLIAQSREGTPVVYDVIHRFELPPGQNKIIINDSRPNLDGSQYLYDDWQKGSIFLNSGDTIKTIKLRFNVFKNEMQFQNNDQVYAIGSPENIKEIILGAHSFIYLNYNEDGKPKKSYFEIISRGNSCLLQFYYSEILPSNFNVALNSGNKNDQLSMKKKYFLKKGDTVIQIDKKGKNIVSAFELRGKEIQKYAKNNKLSFKNESDLIAIINFANSLK